MAVLKRCCCCLNIRTGSLVTGFLFVALSIISLTLRITGVFPERQILGIGGMVIDSIFLVICILLIVGVLKDIKCFCLAWAIYATVFIIIFIATAIIHTAKTVTEYINDGEPLGAVIGLRILWWVIFVAPLSFIAYCVVCVYSHYQNLRDGIKGDVTVTRTETKA